MKIYPYWCFGLFLLVGCGVSQSQSIQVAKSLDGIQCQGQGKTVQQLHQELLQASIYPLDNGKEGDDGIARITVCGASTGAIGIFTISQQDLSKALRLRFIQLKPR